jgi:pSer/pThr/pTyr-binding forkhead associated (FHA) protein
MTEKREIKGHARHKAQGPHFDLPRDFVPLRLHVEGESLQIELACPVAIVGRHSDADVRFAYPEVSRRHCQLVFANGQWRIIDLTSLNGVYVNDARTVEATLYAGDQVRIGCVRLLVESATPTRTEEQHEKLRQIAAVLPAAQV